MSRFRCIAADPPWLERGGGKSKRGADRHYPLMRTSDIYRVMHDAIERAGGMAESCHLWVWVTDNFLRDGLGIIEALGFRYIRTLVWVKADASLDDLDQGDLQVGLGQYLRGSHELCLLGVRGPSMLPPTGDRRSSVVVAPRTRHSAKPREAYDVIESTSPGPRLELFARLPREGWAVFGNEVA